MGFKSSEPDDPDKIHDRSTPLSISLAGIINDSESLFAKFPIKKGGISLLFSEVGVHNKASSMTPANPRSKSEPGPPCPRQASRLKELKETLAMKNRRTFLLAMTSTFVALAVMVAPALADELFGILIKVDIAEKKLTVIEKDTDKEVIVTTTDETEWITKKGSSKLDLTKLEKNITKAKEKGLKGISLKIEHEKAVASKIFMTPKKKAAEPAPPKAE